MQGEDTAKEKTQFFRFAELSRSLTYINVGYGGTVATKKSGLMETAISYQARSEHRIHNIRGNRNTLLITFIKLVWVQRYAKATTPPRKGSKNVNKRLFHTLGDFTGAP